MNKVLWNRWTAKWILLLFFAAGLSFCGSCGYHMGSMAHPQLKTIGIAPVVNDTTLFNLSYEMRQYLSEAFMLDGSLKVKQVDQAQSVLHVTIVDAAFTEVNYTSGGNAVYYRPNEWRVQINCRISLIVPGRKTPIINSVLVSGWAEFQVIGDFENGRYNGAAQACREAARNIVVQITEGF